MEEKSLKEINLDLIRLLSYLEILKGYTEYSDRPFAVDNIHIVIQDMVNITKGILENF